MEIILSIAITSVIFLVIGLYQRRVFNQRFTKYGSLVELLDSLTTETNALEGRRQKLESELLELNNFREQADKCLHGIDAKKSQLNGQILGLEKDLLRARGSYNEFSQKLVNLVEEYKSTKSTYDAQNTELETLKSNLVNAYAELKAVEARTAHLEKLEKNISKMQSEENRLQGEVSLLSEQKAQLTQVMARVDLYSRIDEFTRVGHFETPEYLYETSKRYADEIRDVRDRQKELIQLRQAVTYPQNISLCKDDALNIKILDGQTNLLLNAFNVECDFLIEKVSASNFARTLEQIEKKAETLEKSCATLKCGFSIDYIKLKFEECKLQYEYKLKKQEEQEEQALIREQMREELRLQREYESAIKTAEEDELRLRRLIDKAREELAILNGQEYAITSAKIAELEARLKEAQEKGARAKSLAEQTRRGFVYVISNLGSFGENVYKIGLTRRLDPQERVDELGGASVPFTFDIHAVCFSEDAPALERALHKKFSHKRINAVNFRKEFFKVSLEEIQEALKDLVNEEVDFKFSVKARDYYESRRLLSET